MNIDWLNGRSVVVVLGLVYGYIPYMILPLYAGLDRLPPKRPGGRSRPRAPAGSRPSAGSPCR